MNRVTASINRIFAAALALCLFLFMILGFSQQNIATDQNAANILIITGALILAFVYLIYLAAIKLTEYSEGLEGLLALLASFIGLGLLYLGFNRAGSVSPSLVALIGPVALIICNVLSQIGVMQLKTEKLERALTFAFSLLVTIIVIVMSGLSSI